MPTEFNTLQEVKRRFFAMRNGVIADTMRRAGSPHRIIFGLNLPQIADVAREYYGDTDLALQLWANDTTRESRLAAPMIYPSEEMPETLAEKWALEARDTEEIDILCHRLLRRLPYAMHLLTTLIDRRGACYLTLRLALNLLPKSADIAETLANQATDSGIRYIDTISSQILDELAFLKGGNI